MSRTIKHVSSKRPLTNKIETFEQEVRPGVRLISTEKPKGKAKAKKTKAQVKAKAKAAADTSLPSETPDKKRTESNKG